MDPATAFGIAAGVLQVVHLSFKAFETCRELYKDGSLAENESTKKVTQDLADTVDRLRTTVHGTSTSRLQDPTSKDVIDISTKCSDTAGLLLAELAKLQLESRGSLRKVISKRIQAFRRKPFIEKVEKELREHQRILDTRILVKLDAHALQQGQDFENLDQSVRDLVKNMNEGRNTFAQLLADNRQAVLDHLDRGFAKHAQLNANIDAEKEFKNSLFFPEISSRQEQIPEVQRGTCRWIFRAPGTRRRSLGSSGLYHFSTEGDQLDTDDSQAYKNNENADESDDQNDDDSGNESDNGSEAHKSARQGLVDGSNEYLSQGQGVSAGRASPQPWSDFVSWLKRDEGIYWLNGKPGSGKSTLMNYITSEPRTKKFLMKWANGSDLVIASFFFWKPGTDLQKTLQGLLRSLLYQIADQRKDLIYVMMNKHVSSTNGTKESLDSVGLHTWTVKRLLSVLEYFLTQKPSSVSVCFFIDGLDEFDGEEDTLIEIIRLMSSTTRVKVCVSSRRLPVFLQAFQNSPQLNQQDFNRVDIEKTANDKLRPNLKSSFASEKAKVDVMIKEVCNKAQGVFLWLDLTIKALIKAVRNGDTLEELSVRLETTPDSIEGLYRRMLDRLDKLYLATAVKYFRLLMAPQLSGGEPWTLLGFVCVHYPLWQHILKDDLAYFESLELSDKCHKMENRVLTRCAGLVEISEHPLNVIERMWIDRRNYPAGGSICRHFREVNFIHRSVFDFLETYHQEFLQEPNWRLEANLALARSWLGEMSVLPVARPELYRGVYFVKIHKSIGHLMKIIAAIEMPEAAEVMDRVFEDAAVKLVDETFRVMEHVHVNFNCSTALWYEEYSQMDFDNSVWGRLPFHNHHGFAAYFGCRNYITHHLSLHNCSLEECDYLLECTVIGLPGYPQEAGECQRYLGVIEELVRRGANPNLSIHTLLCSGEDLYCEVSACGMVLKYLIELINRDAIDKNWVAFVKTLVSYGADISTSIFSLWRTDWEAEPIKSRTAVSVELEESPLAYIERLAISRGSDSCKEISNSLRSHGAFERRRYRLIDTSELKFGPWYQLSQNQSDRIVESYKGKFGSRYFGDSLGGRRYHGLAPIIADIVSSLTETDRVDRSTYVLRSSFKSEVDATRFRTSPIQPGTNPFTTG